MRRIINLPRPLQPNRASPLHSFMLPAFTKPQTRRHSQSSPLSFPAAPKSRDRGPPSKEDTQTDFGALDIFAATPGPPTAIDTCMHDGFALSNGSLITEAGVLLLAGEAFAWKPWLVKPTTKHSAPQRVSFDIDVLAIGALDLLWPRPDILILGTGARSVPISPETREQINQLGMRIEIQDTRNAAAQYNMLATERGIQQVAAALLPLDSAI